MLDKDAYYPLSCLLLEMMMLETMEDLKRRSYSRRIAFKNLDVKFADDQGMVTQSDSRLQTIMDA